MIGMGTTIFLVNPVNFPSGTSYLLDTYSAAAAYSLRQLKTGVTNVVRVRRSGDNAESDFTATEITDGSLASWVDAGGGTKAGLVAVWYDQVGSADFSQSTATIQPEIYDSINGLRLMECGNVGLSFPIASSDYMITGAGFTQLNSEPYSVFYVAQNNESNQGVSVLENANVGGTGKCQFRLDTDGTSNLMVRYKNSSGTNYDLSASTNLASSTTYLISTFADSSKNMSEFDDGSTGGTNTFTGSYTGTDCYLGRADNGASYLKGLIGEVIVFGTDESANRTDIETDINTHYSIY